LRVKLDQGRLEFLRTDLDVSRTFADMAETEYELGHLEAAWRSLEHGEQGYATLRKFLTDTNHTRHLTGDQLQELKTGIEKLKQQLDGFRRLHATLT
jgi:hypothetical protein